MVDRNTAFYFLDKNETGRYEWFVTSIIQWNIVGSREWTILMTKYWIENSVELLTCEESLKELSADLVAVAKDTAKEQLTPAKLQVVNSFLWILYISPRNILLVMSDIYSDAINSFWIIYFL